MRCTLMTKEDISPHMIQNKISEKRYYISLKEYEKILLLTDWASSHYHHLFVFVLFFSKLQQLPVYNIVFHSWAQNVFLFVLSPLFPLNTLKPQSFFFSPSSARKLTKCQLSFLTMHTHTHTHPFKTFLGVCFSVVDEGTQHMSRISYWAETLCPLIVTPHSFSRQCFIVFTFSHVSY